MRFSTCRCILSDKGGVFKGIVVSAECFQHCDNTYKIVRLLQLSATLLLCIQIEEVRWHDGHFHLTVTFNLSKRGVIMTKNEKDPIEKMADEAEAILETDYEKKDLKEKRSLTKETLYDGSKKLKHSVPKGKRV